MKFYEMTIFVITINSVSRESILFLYQELMWNLFQHLMAERVVVLVFAGQFVLLVGKREHKKYFQLHKSVLLN